MSTTKSNNALSFMSIDELKSYILSSYNLEIYNIESIKFKDTDKQRAVYKIFSDKGCFCLKKVFYDKENLLFIYSITEWLNLNNVKCPRFYPTAKGHKFVNHNNNLFILTEWVDGRKCDYDNTNDIIDMATNLAKIHISTNRFKAIQGSNLRIAENNYCFSQVKHFYQLLEFWNRSVHYNDSFSQLYMDDFDYNFSMGAESLRIINEIDFKANIGDSISNFSICHLDYVNKNIIFDKDNTIFTIDFDNTRFDYPIHDICYFLRRILKRDQTCWDFELFKRMISSYEKIRKLSYTEHLLMLALLMFPQKYWKLSKDYFKNRRSCNHTVFINNMKKLSQKQNEHEKFVYLLKEYINDKF